MIIKNKWRSVQNERATIPKDKLKHFTHVFSQLVAHYGSAKAAIEISGIGWTSYYRMINDKALSVSVAHKIMDAYKVIAPYKNADANTKTA